MGAVRRAEERQGFLSRIYNLLVWWMIPGNGEASTGGAMSGKAGLGEERQGEVFYENSLSILFEGDRFHDRSNR